MRQTLDRINAFLDKHVLPWPVHFLTTRFVILATIALLIPLIAYASNTVLVLSLNSYLNTMSVAVSSIVLLYATLAEVRQKQIAALQEQRAQEDHAHIIGTHELIMRALANQREEIEDLKELIASMQGKTHTRQAAQPLPDLRALHPQGAARFEKDHARQRLAENVQPNAITAGVYPDLPAGH